MLAKIALLLLVVTSLIGLQLFSEEAWALRVYIEKEYIRNLAWLFKTMLYVSLGFIMTTVLVNQSIEEMKRKAYQCTPS